MDPKTQNYRTQALKEAIERKKIGKKIAQTREHRYNLLNSESLDVIKMWTVAIKFESSTYKL